MYIVSNMGTDMGKIEALENWFGREIPDDYKDFLFHTNGGTLNDDTGITIDVPNSNIKVSVKKFYGLGTEEDDLMNVNYRVWEALYASGEQAETEGRGEDKVEEKKEPTEQSETENGEINDFQLLIIGEDTLGQYIAINFVQNVSYICYWDKDMKQQSSSDDENAYFISNSFEQFVHMIENNEKGDENMEKVNYLPLGSIVLMEGGIQKLIITSRGLVVQHNDEQVFFDYAGVPYPQGLISDDLLYFNHENIAKVVFEGYKDDDDEVIVGNIHKFIEGHPDMIKGDPKNW